MEELLLRNSKFVDPNLSSDVINYKKWRIINDSTISIYLIPYNVEILNDSLFIGVNKKHNDDTIKLIKINR